MVFANEPSRDPAKVIQHGEMAAARYILFARFALYRHCSFQLDPHALFEIFTQDLSKNTPDYRSQVNHDRDFGGDQWYVRLKMSPVQWPTKQTNPTHFLGTYLKGRRASIRLGERRRSGRFFRVGDASQPLSLLAPLSRAVTVALPKSTRTISLPARRAAPRARSPAAPPRRPLTRRGRRVSRRSNRNRHTCSRRAVRRSEAA